MSGVLLPFMTGPWMMSGTPIIYLHTIITVCMIFYYMAGPKVSQMRVASPFNDYPKMR